LPNFVILMPRIQMSSLAMGGLLYWGSKP
jgi:hypothetical protein